MSEHQKVDEWNIHNTYYLKAYTAPDHMTFKGLLGMLRPDFKPSSVTVTEDGDWDMKSYGEETYDYEHYISHYGDTKDGEESLGGTTASGAYVSVNVIRNEEMKRTEIRTMSKDPSVELDQIIIMDEG